MSTGPAVRLQPGLLVLLLYLPGGLVDIPHRARTWLFATARGGSRTRQPTAGRSRSISGRLYCLEAGRVTAEGEPDTICADPRVVASYLGTDELALARSGSGSGSATGAGAR